MAIVQISRITNRKGRQENLPQLAGAELGWAIDSRRLFIGNGTLQEGAPIIGNTEILTEFSDITALSNYTYADIAVGYAAQTGPTISDPVVRSVQAKLDDMASVRDFGAVGDGQTDDTAAIQRALIQLYCRENNTQIRRSLFFPAGTYRVTDTIRIPTYAKLIGEGGDCTIIELHQPDDSSAVSPYVARFADSDCQTGVNIGANGAVTPRHIEISAMTFRSVESTDIFLVEAAENCWFSSVWFRGNLSEDDIIDTGFNPAVTNTAGVRFLNSGSVNCSNITFDLCGFTNLTYAINTDEAIAGTTVSNSLFYTLYQGVVLTDNPTGTRIVHNQFDSIFAEAVVLGSQLNVTSYNAFYNVGNNIGGTSPVTPVVRITNNNVSVGDIFERSDADNVQVPRVEITNTASTSGAVQTASGNYISVSGRRGVIADNQTSAQVIFYVSSLDSNGFTVNYKLSRGGETRVGTLTVVPGVTYADDYVESAATGVTLAARTGAIPNTVEVVYTSTNLGSAGTIDYTVSYFS